MNELPSDILYRIISFDALLSAPNMYKLNKAMRTASYSDPNFIRIIYSKFQTLVEHNTKHSITRVVSLQNNTIDVVSAFDEVKVIIDAAIGHPEFSLNNYVSILMDFGASMNLQIANLQKNLALGVLDIEKMQKQDVDEDNLNELISVWYGLRNRVDCMLHRINAWLALQIKMEEHVDAISYNAMEWQGKMEWILTRDIQMRQQLNEFIVNSDESIEQNIASFISINAHHETLFEQSFVRWTADHIQKQDLIFQMMTIRELVELSNNFHDAFRRMLVVCKSMKEMTVSVLKHDITQIVTK